MAMQKDFTLKYDTTGILAASKSFHRCANEMYTIQQELNAAFKTLRSQDWRGKASDRLDEIIGNDWSLKVQRYCDLMKQLTTIMDSAVQTYEHIEAEAQRLQLNVSRSGGGGMSGGRL